MTHRPRKDRDDSNRYDESFLNIGDEDAGRADEPGQGSDPRPKFDPEADEVMRDLGLPSEQGSGRRNGGDIFSRMRDEESYGESRD